MHTKLTLDRSEKLIIAETRQDVEPILEHNKVLQGIPQKSDWGRHVASVPNVVLVGWLNEEHRRGNTQMKMFGPGFMELVQRKLQDPDWRHLRVDK